MFKKFGLSLVGMAIFISPVSAKTDFGIDVLKKEKFKTLEDARIALITNHTGVDKYGASTVDILSRAPNVKLICLLSPEHGIHGTVTAGELVENSTDVTTGVPVFSLYGKSPRPTDEMLAGVDTIVFDIQDIGTRFYTYITTMGMAMEEAAKRKIRFVVLDRANPIRGDVVEGDILDADIKRMTGYFSIPVRHGLTVGELAQWMNATQNLGVSLEVVPMKNWKRDQWFDQTGHDFIPPSPNIPNLTAALLYSGVGNFEATNIAVGRGTAIPFEVFGAPWLDGKALCAFLRQKNIAGAAFETIQFTPDKDMYKGEKCNGVRVIVTNRNHLRPFQIFLASFFYMYANHPEFKPIWEEVRVVTGSPKLKQAIDEGRSYEETFPLYEPVGKDFVEKAKSFYLYP